MDQTTVTILCGLFLIVVIAVSFVRCKQNGEDLGQTPRPTVKETMREVSEYFGIDAQPGDSVSNAFDLAPLKMASALNDPTKSSPKKSKKRRR